MSPNLETARLVARRACEQFLQVPVLPTDKWVEWLKQRDIGFSSWEHIHFLWRIGVARPVALTSAAANLTPNMINRDRLSPLDSSDPAGIWIDAGTAVDTVPWIEGEDFALDRQLAQSLLWHPYQLDDFCQLGSCLKQNFDESASLHGGFKHGEFVSKLTELVPDGLKRFANAPERDFSRRMLTLQLSIDPIMRPRVVGSVRFSSLPEAEAEYDKWLADFTQRNVLDECGLTIDEAAEWHRHISTYAYMRDPISHFRVLLQHVERSDLERLGPPALFSLELYDQAVMLRRYCEESHGRELMEEDGYFVGNDIRQVNLEWYGSERTLDASRSSRRRILRAFGLDSQAKAHCFFEGETEVAFFSELARLDNVELENRGVLVFDLHGNGNVRRNKGSSRRMRSDLVRLALSHCKSEGIFAFVAVDREYEGNEPDHVRDVRVLAGEDLLTAGYQIWEPDFETANFSHSQLAEAATELIRQAGKPGAITACDIELKMSEKQWPAGKAIEDLINRAHASEGKGADWGRILADIAYRDRERGRPYVDVFRRMVSIRWADFDDTFKHFSVGPEGRLVERTDSNRE